MAAPTARAPPGASATLGALTAGNDADELDPVVFVKKLRLPLFAPQGGTVVFNENEAGRQIESSDQVTDRRDALDCPGVAIHYQFHDDARIA